jgi:hypothetical protein
MPGASPHMTRFAKAARFFGDIVTVGEMHTKQFSPTPCIGRCSVT